MCTNFFIFNESAKPIFKSNFWMRIYLMILYISVSQPGGREGFFRVVANTIHEIFLLNCKKIQNFCNQRFAVMLLQVVDRLYKFYCEY